jgi:hypothetical protein
MQIRDGDDLGVETGQEQPNGIAADFGGPPRQSLFLQV